MSLLEHAIIAVLLIGHIASCAYCAGWRARQGNWENAGIHVAMGLLGIVLFASLLSRVCAR